MAKIQTQVDLLPFNTFGVFVKAKKFLTVDNLSDLSNLSNLDNPLFLGQGANILFTKDYDGLVVKNNLLAKKILSEDENGATLEIASGESWIELVNWTVDHDWSGIENLAYIPGTAGAAVVGNIGAYGQTFEDVFISAKSGKDIFYRNDCCFDYRESAFKHQLKNIFIESVTIKLGRNCEAKKKARETTARRQANLPNWKALGTAGSFFKNPFITADKLVELKKDFPDIPNFPDTPDKVKIPAGYLLEKLGWKGKRIGNVGTYDKHALVIVNYGGASGQEIVDFARQMQADVKKNFGIELEPEVNII